MRIVIKTPGEPERRIEQSIVHWKLFAQKYNSTILIEFLGGLFFFIIGIKNGYTWKSTINETTTSYTYNFPLSMGVAFILLALISFFNILRSKNQFFKKVKLSMQSYISDNASMEIDDTTVKYRDFELIQEVKWSLFTHYKFYKNYLFLITNGNYLSAIVIDKRLLNDNEFAELFSLVKKRLIEKK